MMETAEDEFPSRMAKMSALAISMAIIIEYDDANAAQATEDDDEDTLTIAEE
jgi:hypothetical protein